MEALTESFRLREREWADLHESVASDLDAFIASRHSGKCSPILDLIPRGPGYNADPGIQKAERSFIALEKAPKKFADLLAALEVCVDRARRVVRASWKKGRNLSATLSNSCLIDAVHEMEIKLLMHRDEYELKSDKLGALRWDADERDLMCIQVILSSQPFIEVIDDARIGLPN